MMEKETTVFECICGSTDHILVATRWYDEEDGDDWEEFYFEIQAHYNNGFWRRIWVGLKYVWNPSEGGCFWSGTSLSRDECQKLREALTRFIDRVRPENA